jgi:hypothetical protein
VNHAEPATPCGNVVDRTAPSPLEGKPDSAAWLQRAIVGSSTDTEPAETTRRPIMVGSKPYGQLRYRNVNGKRMAYIDEGQGDAIVFAHGAVGLGRQARRRCGAGGGGTGARGVAR